MTLLDRLPRFRLRRSLQLVDKGVETPGDILLLAIDQPDAL